MRRSAKISISRFSLLVFFTDLLFRCEMEEQVLGKINGDFTNRDSESHDSQVTLIQMLCLEIKSYQSYRN